MIIKPIIRKIFIISFLLPLATGMFFLDSWAQPETPSNENTDPVNLTADRMLHLVEKNLVKAEGHVVVTYGARTVSADEIIINTETGKGQAKGNVVMTAEQGTKFQAEKAQFNIKAEKGRLFKVAGKLGDLYYITGDEVTKLSENHYTAQNSTLTTCTGEIPDWQIDVADADVILDDRAWFAGGVFRIKNIPILYIPVGYVPILTKRKSGLLAPRVSTSSVEGETVAMAYFWAINQWSDATIGVDYVERRGIRSRTEFRYTPNKTTSGQVNFVFLDDNLTQSTFWKLDATHRQQLPLGFKLNAKIDQTSKANFNQTFRNQTELRTRRSSDSYASLFRKWDNHSFDVLARFRESEQFDLDETFGLLPTVTYKTQPVEIKFLSAYFDQEVSYTHFLFDLDTSSTSDLTETSQRFDYHPSLALPINIAPWLQLTPRVGFRETFYNKEIPASPGVAEGDSFSREMVDVNVLLEGPKFNRIFLSDDPEGSSFKHVIEPRLQYDYIPDIDRSDRAKIRLVDGIDAVENVNQLSLFLVQRLLRKGSASDKDTEVRQIARLEISQSYDLDEARGQVIPGNPRRPFSPIRFDLDSKLSDNFFLNTDFTYNVYSDALETWNIDAGIKLNKWLMLIFERRERDDPNNQTASILGTLDVTLPKGWNAKYSIRYDEFTDELLEHNTRLTYNDKCMCWGFSIDYIDRNIFNGTGKTNDTRFLFSISLKGLGNFDGSRGESFLHRTF